MREAVPFSSSGAVPVTITLGGLWGMTPVAGLFRSQALKNWGVARLASVTRGAESVRRKGLVWKRELCVVKLGSLFSCVNSYRIERTIL